eukprot:scaffold11799_cov63-Phaeocystis_antarctica.AAC.1
MNRFMIGNTTPKCTFWANGSDCGIWERSGFLALAPRSRPLQAAPYASSGPHPSPAASPAIVEEPRARKVAVRKVLKVVQKSGAHVLPGRP